MAQRDEITPEGAFFLMAAGFTPFYQHVTFCCIIKAAREHPEIAPDKLLPMVAAEMEAAERILEGAAAPA